MFREKNVFRLNLEKLILVNDFALLLGTYTRINISPGEACILEIGLGTYVTKAVR